MKKFIRETVIFQILADAWAFIVNREARIASQFNYPSGNPMSIRDARKKGLIK